MRQRNLVVMALLASGVLAIGWTIGKSDPQRRLEKEQEMMRIQQVSCPEQCRGSYGQCMKASANRPVCQNHLDSCLKSCVAARGAR